MLSEYKLTQAIESTLALYLQKGWVKSAYDVGSGLCEEFAEDVNKLLGDPKELQVVEYANYTGKLGCEVCDEIFYAATLVKFKVPLPEGITTRFLNKTPLGCCGMHVFLRLGQKWFDAEAPKGVPSPFLLPFAQRYIEKIQAQELVTA